jgi:EpsG-like putative glucosyltransferase
MMGSDLLPYISLFLVAAIPALILEKRFNHIAWPAAWAFFVLFVGLRHRIGGDWGNYVRKTDLIGRLPFDEAIWVQDPLFSLLARLSHDVGLGVYGTNFVGALIFCTGLFSFCARQSNRWLALVTATPFLVVGSVMSASRQGIAIGIVLYVLSRWQEFKLPQRSFGIVIAGLFHASAFVLLLLTIIDLKISYVRKGILSALILASTLWLTSRTDTGLLQYADIYVFNQSVEASGAISHLLLNLVPALLILLTRKWWAKRVEDWPVIQSLCLIALMMALLVPFYSQAVSRMSLYLFPISITFLALLPRAASSESGRAFVKMVSLAAMAFVLVVWVGYSNQSRFYLPYQNALTTSSDKLDWPK